MLRKKTKSLKHLEKNYLVTMIGHDVYLTVKSAGNEKKLHKNINFTKKGVFIPIDIVNSTNKAYYCK